MSTDENKVVVYYTSSCPWCVKAKEYLASNNVPFSQVDVGADKDAAREIVQMTHQRGVPVIKIGERYIVGFDQDAIKSGLKEINLL
ncbi:MAG: NrdH-redoxin [Synergistaceae bacterium]|nr:NrdH-redoxin [Synergistaceae bacterium]